MKRIFVTLIVACALVAAMPMHAVCECLSVYKQIDLSVRIFNPGETKGSKPKTSVRKPTVYIEDNVLYLEGIANEYVLQLQNGEGVAYEMSVPAGTQEIYLPEDLTGSYELLLIFVEYSFVGEVTL